MNVVPKERSWIATSNEEPADARSELGRFSGFLRRRATMMLAGAVAAVVLAIIYLQNASPAYQSVIRIVLTEDQTKLLQEISGVQAAKNADEYIATQIGLMESESVARRVVTSLGLAQNEAFMADHPSMLRQLVGRLIGAHRQEVDPETGEALDPETRAVDRLRSTLSVYRIDRSFIIELAYVSFDPKLARDVATAYGAAYLSDQTEAHFSALNRASVWLEGRIEDLRGQSLAANREVEAFRAQNDLIAANGRLVAEQNLLGMNNQMVLAEADYTRVKARLQVYEDAIQSGSVDTIIGVLGTSPEIAQNTTIQQLRSDYLQASDRERAIVAQWGETNPQVAAVRAEKERLSHRLVDEATRFVASYRNDLEAGRSQIENLSSTIRTASGKTQNANSTLVTLRSLEQRADSYQTIYQSYLTRYQEALQQQSLPINTARIISEAQFPEEPILPKKRITLALALVVGLLAGAGGGLLMEVRDRGLRTYEDAGALRLDFLGYLPKLGRRPVKGGRNPLATFGLVSEVGDRAAVETLRGLKAASDVASPRGGRIIGIVSFVGGEGKSLVAAGLANLTAGGGQSVLLVDGNTVHPALSAALAPKGGPNFLDVLTGRARATEAMRTLESGARFLPAPDRPSDALPRATTVAPLLALQAEEWRSRFAVTIVELPDIASTSDAKAVGELVDQVLFVAEWGGTDRNQCDYLLQAHPVLWSKAIGLVLTKVDMDTLHRYDPFHRSVGTARPRRFGLRPSKRSWRRA